MKEIKLIDILSGKEKPDKIKYRGIVYTLINKEENSYDYIDSYNAYLLESVINSWYLSGIQYEKVEIIEEKPKKIEECKSYDSFEGVDDYIEHLRGKIDELTKAVNYLLEKESDK